MMLRRFKLFAIGVLIGSVVLIYLFQNKDQGTWLPKNKLRENLRKYPISFSEKSTCQLNCLKLEEKELKKSFETAEIDFSKSQVDKKPCPVYQMDIETEKGTLSAFVEICDSTNALVSITGSDKIDSCKCD